MRGTEHRGDGIERRPARCRRVGQAGRFLGRLHAPQALPAGLERLASGGVEGALRGRHHDGDVLLPPAPAPGREQRRLGGVAGGAFLRHERRAALRADVPLARRPEDDVTALRAVLDVAHHRPLSTERHLSRTSDFTVDAVGGRLRVGEALDADLVLAGRDQILQPLLRGGQLAALHKLAHLVVSLCRADVDRARASIHARHLLVGFAAHHVEVLAQLVESEQIRRACHV
mmetsp:Transcript_89861/g.275083  ORF Transcript_89861/g.275083 Transcript_89861/m.275083 type:complete len:230 (+) Transcript_89861:1908-2597(+)